ncbi:MAG: nickel pincer cofactor biosynthesis protein LarC [Nitrospinae bacterium]|nr:nickel pincer cofactor biosynthesis protein LarC [Nitrospinota bacterium]
MKIAYFDTFSGISGDMVLGGLIDIGVDIRDIRTRLKGLGIKGYSIEVSTLERGGIVGTKADVIVKDRERDHISLNDIKRLIDESDLEPLVKRDSIHIFERIGEAEAKVHNIPKEEVHFHEIGAVDSIIDIVGSMIGIHILNIGKIISSPINTGKGYVICQHGLLPIPAPATAELLKGYPCYSSDTEYELTTPTGAAIITTLASEFGSLPLIEVEKVGYGAGSKELKDLPNLLRIIIGEDIGSHMGDTITVIETNIDDMNPEFYDYVSEKAFEMGALDYFITPIIMKKNRPAAKISILADSKDIRRLTDLLLRETSTLGIRSYQVKRVKLERESREIETRYGYVTVVIAKEGEKILKISPEYKECQEIARRYNVPLYQVYEETKAQARLHFGM